MPTIEEVQAELEQNKTELSKVNQELSDLRSQSETNAKSLSDEAAKYRTERNNALRQAHVLGTVVKKHNIEFDVRGIDLTKLEIENGAVKGEFEYKPAEPKDKTNPPVNNNPPQGYTMEQINKMSVDEIANLSADDHKKLMADFARLQKES